MRYHHMDFLRGALMIVGVLYHTARVAMPGDGWYISTTENSNVYGWLVIFLGSFRMQTFFLISGFFAALLIDRLGSKSYLSKRLGRIAIPLITCGVTVQLLVRKDMAWSLHFWINGEWVGHLWFLVHLLCYMLLAIYFIPFIRLIKIRVTYIPFFLTTALFFMLFSAVSWRLPQVPMIDSKSFLPYLVFFISGSYIFINKDFLLDKVHNFRKNLYLLLVGLLIMVYFFNSDSYFKYFGNALWALSLSGILLFLSKELEDRYNVYSGFLGRSSYTVYLFHEPFIIMIGALFIALNPHTFFFSFVFSTTLVCWAIHALVIERSPILHWLYNGKPIDASKPIWWTRK